MAKFRGLLRCSIVLQLLVSMGRRLERLRSGFERGSFALAVVGRLLRGGADACLRHEGGPCVRPVVALRGAQCAVVRRVLRRCGVVPWQGGLDSVMVGQRD